MDTTQHDLKILSICYYIMAGITGGNVFLVGGYIVFFSAILANVPLRDASGKGLPGFIPTLLAAIGAAMIGFGFLSAACMAFAAWSLPKRRNYVLIMAAAVLNCLQVPFGTVLGVFTFVVLNRPGVRESFRTGPPVLPPPLPLP